MTKKVLIIAAMEDVELNYLKLNLGRCKKTEYKRFNFYEGSFANKSIILCVCNIGIINAAVGVTIAIEKYNPDFIINEGLAGGYVDTIKKGDILIAEDAINISSMEYKGNGNSIEDYEITTFLHGEENKLISRKGNKDLIDFVKDNFKEYNLHFGRLGSRRYLE